MFSPKFYFLELIIIEVRVHSGLNGRLMERFVCEYTVTLHEAQLNERLCKDFDLPQTPHSSFYLVCIRINFNGQELK